MSTKPLTTTCQWHIANYIYLFNILDNLPYGNNPPSIPTIVQDIMMGATSSAEGVLADFPTPILPKIGGEPTIEGLIKLHQFVGENVLSVLSNLR